MPRVYISPMRILPAWVLAAAFGASTASAQTTGPTCAAIDSIAVEGNKRVSRSAIIGDAGLQKGDTVDQAAMQLAFRRLMISAQFEAPTFDCKFVGPNKRPVLVINVIERPLMKSVNVVGVERLTLRQVTDKMLLVPGRVADPLEINRARVAVDSLYRSKSYYLSRIVVDSALDSTGVAITFRISEGRRLAISGITIEGNTHVSDEEIVSHMGTKPEGFLWGRTGEFDEVQFQVDLSDSIPTLYASHGFIDAEVMRDTLIVNPDLGKAMIVIHVKEGVQYKVGSFDIIGNRHFETFELQPLFPFREKSPTIAQRVQSVFGRQDDPFDVFDLTRWYDATGDLASMYRNDGYREANVVPIMERARAADSSYVVNLRWEIAEGQQAIINRIDIVGNLFTVESCIRQQLRIFPGSVYNEALIIQSMQGIQSMGFFEDPPQNPDFEPVNDSLGLLNIKFTVVEKKTGSINFGASMGGGGGGLGGFVGFDQPNLFGKCKRGSLNWQFGSLINEFSLTYSDPSVRKSNISASTSLYSQRSRYVVADFGRQTRRGGSLRVGFPIFNAFSTRAFLSYGGEAVKYSRDETSLLGQLAALCNNCFRSTFGANLTRDTRLGLPFATSGDYQTLDAQFNGGPLGGTSDFQRYTAELRSYVDLGSVGGDEMAGKAPIRFVFGFSLRTGMVFGNTGPFFPNQEFAMGGVQQGEPLRGYDEFTITPEGYVPEGSNLQARRESFGRAYMSATAEVGARLSQGVYVNAFFDAGNVWRDPRDFNPTRMFRGAGVGVSLLTPLGPLGLDYAYGFDRLDQFGKPDPGWKLHFKLGQLF